MLFVTGNDLNKIQLEYEYWHLVVCNFDGEKNAKSSEKRSRSTKRHSYI